MGKTGWADGDNQRLSRPFGIIRLQVAAGWQSPGDLANARCWAWRNRDVQLLRQPRAPRPEAGSPALGIGISAWLWKALPITMARERLVPRAPLAEGSRGSDRGRHIPGFRRRKSPARQSPRLANPPPLLTAVVAVVPVRPKGACLWTWPRDVGNPLIPSRKSFGAWLPTSTPRAPRNSSDGSRSSCRSSRARSPSGPSR